MCTLIRSCGVAHHLGRVGCSALFSSSERGHVQGFLRRDAPRFLDLELVPRGRSVRRSLRCGARLSSRGGGGCRAAGLRCRGLCHLATQRILFVRGLRTRFVFLRHCGRRRAERRRERFVVHLRQRSAVALLRFEQLCLVHRSLGFSLRFDSLARRSVLRGVALGAIDVRLRCRRRVEGGGERGGDHLRQRCVVLLHQRGSLGFCSVAGSLRLLQRSTLLPLARRLDSRRLVSLRFRGKSAPALLCRFDPRRCQRVGVALRLLLRSAHGVVRRSDVFSGRLRTAPSLSNRRGVRRRARLHRDDAQLFGSRARVRRGVLCYAAPPLRRDLRAKRLDDASVLRLRRSARALVSRQLARKLLAVPFVAALQRLLHLRAGYGRRARVLPERAGRENDINIDFVDVDGATPRHLHLARHLAAHRSERRGVGAENHTQRAVLRVFAFAQRTGVLARELRPHRLRVRADVHRVLLRSARHLYAVRRSHLGPQFFRRRRVFRLRTLEGRDLRIRHLERSHQHSGAVADRAGQAAFRRGGGEARRHAIERRRARWRVADCGGVRTDPTVADRLCRLGFDLLHAKCGDDAAGRRFVSVHGVEEALPVRRRRSGLARRAHYRRDRRTARRRGVERRRVLRSRAVVHSAEVLLSALARSVRRDGARRALRRVVTLDARRGELRLEARYRDLGAATLVPQRELALFERRRELGLGRGELGVQSERHLTRALRGAALLRDERRDGVFVGRELLRDAGFKRA